MDANLKYLINLWNQHGEFEPFELEDINFFLTDDGRNWLIQVSHNPPKFKFSDLALLHIKNPLQ